MRSVQTAAAIALAMAVGLTGVSRAEPVYSEDFFLVTAGRWGQDTDCPSSQAPGHSAPDVLRLGSFRDCDSGFAGGVASTPSISTTGNCSLSFNYFLDYEADIFEVSFEVSANDVVLASSSDGSLVNNATWTTVDGLVLPSGDVVIDFIGDVPAGTGGSSVTGAGFLIDDVVVDCPPSPDPVYSEDFFLVNIDNSGSQVVGWAYNTFCASSQASGHSVPGVLRWGVFGDCQNFGDRAVASTPSISTTSNCSLGFNYLLDCTLSSCQPEHITFEVRANGQVLASFADGALVNNATWTTIDGLNLPSGGVVIDFIADSSFGTGGGTGVSYGAGFLIDDLTVDCPSGDVPATSGWGVVVLIVGISLAISVALLRRRQLAR